MTVKPKLPMSSYMMWLNSNRDTIKSQNPGLKVTELAKKGGEIWRAMKDKSEWEEKAAKAKEQYQKELAIYETNRRGVTQEPDEYDMLEERGYCSSCDYTDYDEDENNHFLNDKSDYYNARHCGGAKQLKNAKLEKAAEPKHQHEKYLALKKAKNAGPRLEDMNCQLKSSSEPPNITCSYKSTGCLYPQKNGFMYVPETPVNISFQDIVNVKVARGQDCSNQQSFDLEILLKSGDVHTFHGISQGEYEKLINYIACKNVHVKKVLFMFDDDAGLEYDAKNYQNTEVKENQSVAENAKPAMERGVADVKKEI